MSPKKKKDSRSNGSKKGQENDQNKTASKVSKPYAPPLWCNTKRVKELKNEIQFMKKHSNVMDQIRTYAFDRTLLKGDIDKFIVKVIHNMFSSEKARFITPGSVIRFHTSQDEISANMMFGGKDLKQYQKYREMYKQLIPRECSITMCENNPVFDWSFMGVVKALNIHAHRVYQGKSDLYDSRFVNYVNDMVNKYIESRNEIEIFAKQIERANKGKFITINDIKFEFLFHKSNYFDIMFQFLAEDGDEHKERAYIKYYEEIFLVNPDPALPRREEFLNVRKDLKLADGWILADDEIHLNQLVSK